MNILDKITPELVDRNLFACVGIAAHTIGVTTADIMQGAKDHAAGSWYDILDNRAKLVEYIYVLIVDCLVLEPDMIDLIRDIIEFDADYSNTPTIEPEAFYLDYFNNYISVDKIAEHYGIDVYRANALITKGRELNHVL